MLLLGEVLIIEVDLVASNQTDHARVNQFQKMDQFQIRVLQLHLDQVVRVILPVFLHIQNQQPILL